MRIALTGATGYTGGRLLERFRGRGHDVTALARPGSSRIADPGVHWIEGDLADRDALARLVAGAEAVVHVAAVYRTAGHPDSYYRDVNVGGTERLLDKAARDFWTKNRSFSIERARHLLGYEPKVDVEEGVARTAAWYRQAGWL